MNFSDVLDFGGGFVKGRIPMQLVVQITDRCNAKCPQCGMRVTEKFSRTRIPLDTLHRIIDAAAAKNVAALSFTGGEPLLYLDDLAGLIRYAGRAGISFIRTGTNGFLLANPDDPGFDKRVRRTVETLAATPLRNFWISLDSAEPSVHDAMRGFPGLFEGVRKALPVFHAAGIFPAANLGLNRNTGGFDSLPVAGNPDDTESDSHIEGFFLAAESALDRFFCVARDMGFTMVNVCYPMSSADGATPVYEARSESGVVNFGKREKAALFSALLKVIPRHRSKIRIFTPLCDLFALSEHYSGNSELARPCHGGRDFFFIEAKTADTYPCGYRGGENLGPFEDLDMGIRRNRPFCRECDWECFRDPSQLLGPFADIFQRPLQLVRHFAQNPLLTRHWLNDLSYYRACGNFDGRKAPDMKALARFAQSNL